MAGKCSVRHLGMATEAKAACDAYVAEHGGRVVELGISCMEVVDGEGFVRLQVYFRPDEGKANGQVCHNLSPRAKNGIK